MKHMQAAVARAVARSRSSAFWRVVAITAVLLGAAGGSAVFAAVPKGGAHGSRRVEHRVMQKAHAKATTTAKPHNPAKTTGHAASGVGSVPQTKETGDPGWVGTWSAAQVEAGTSGLSATGFDDQTVRDIVHTSVGGSELRLRISNVFGKQPLVVSGLYVGIQSSGATVEAGSNQKATFDGSDSVTIQPGDQTLSDPVKLSVGAEQNLVVSIYFAGATGPATWHPEALGTNYYASGGAAAEASGANYTNSDSSWYFLDGVDVYNPAVRGAVVTFGASTTDGVASTANANERYPDDLARRLLALPAGKQMSVLNAGISGNQLLTDSATDGAAGVARFYRDVVQQAGVRDVIVWLGTNDIGDNPDLTASQITDAYTELIDIAHTYGIKVIGATLQPDKGASYYTAEGNATREQVNAWIRESGAFDGVADFDKVLLNPSEPHEMLPAYNSGDGLHPNDAGYQAIASSINLEMLTTPSRVEDFSGTASPSALSLTLGTGDAMTESVTVHSLSDKSYTLPWQLSAPAGSDVSFAPSGGRVTVPADGTATVTFKITAGASEGSFPVTFNLSDSNGESALATQFTVVSEKPGDLAPLYNNTGISDNGAVDQANLEGDGYSYSEQALTAAGLAPGATVAVGDLSFTWPDVPAGSPDNVEAAGQTIVPDVPAGSSEIGFLGAGANSGTTGSEGPVTIDYTDGTSTTEELGFGGYALGFGGPVLFGNATVATLPYRNYENGTEEASTMYVFEQGIAIDPSKTVASITLPTTVSKGQIHVFAISQPTSGP